MKCTECDGQLEEGYNFCPHCGSPVSSIDELRQSIGESFDRLEEVVYGDALLRLENLSLRLIDIESELDTFILSKK